MSALGHKRTLDCRALTSALPPKADIPWHDLHVRLGPEPDYEATTGGFQLLIVSLIERATTVIDPVAAPALLRSYLCFRRFSLTLNSTIFATRPTGIGFSMGNCTAPLEVL
jgi:hypothetical protein